jgi:hypothetical protein
MFTENTLFTPNYFYCNDCDFKCSKNCDWNRHLSTRKHKNVAKMFTNVDDFTPKITPNKIQNFICDCGKEYKYRQSLYVHKKKCFYKNQEIDNESEESTGELAILTNMIVEMMKTNQDLQKSLVEVCKNGISNSNTQISNNNTMVNSNNKTFNLQVFLNETCKDAMNIMDFVDSLQIQLSDLENVGRNGFVAGISDIILKNLKALDITQRPIHCSDQKREVIYIKDDNQWYNDSKEQPENQKLKKAIKYIAHKNTCLIKEWKAKYPDCGQSASRKSDLYNKIVYESMSHDNANAEKIIKRIAKEIGIDSTFKKSGAKLTN